VGPLWGEPAPRPELQRCCRKAFGPCRDAHPQRKADGLPGPPDPDPQHKRSASRWEPTRAGGGKTCVAAHRRTRIKHGNVVTYRFILWQRGKIGCPQRDSVATSEQQQRHSRMSAAVGSRRLAVEGRESEVGSRGSAVRGRQGSRQSGVGARRSAAVGSRGSAGGSRKLVLPGGETRPHRQSTLMRTCLGTSTMDASLLVNSQNRMHENSKRLGVRAAGRTEAGRLGG
jgi:hypothetical protein